MDIEAHIPLVIAVIDENQTNFQNNYARYFTQIDILKDNYFESKSENDQKLINGILNHKSKNSKNRTWYTINYDLLNKELNMFMIDFLRTKNSIIQNQDLYKYCSIDYISGFEEYQEQEIVDFEKQLSLLPNNYHNKDTISALDVFFDGYNEYGKKHDIHFSITNCYDSIYGYSLIVNTNGEHMPYEAYELLTLDFYDRWKSQSVVSISGILKIHKMYEKLLGEQYQLVKLLGV